MNIPDVVKVWNARCAQCGDCKVNAAIFLPSCPPGARFKFSSYYATGKMLIGRGLQEGELTLEDDDVLERLYTCTMCRACDENCGNLIKGHIVDIIEGLRQMAVSAGCHADISAANQGASVVVAGRGMAKRSGAGGAGVDHWHAACTNPCSKVSPLEYTEGHYGVLPSLFLWTCTSYRSLGKLGNAARPGKDGCANQGY